MTRTLQHRACVVAIILATAGYGQTRRTASVPGAPQRATNALQTTSAITTTGNTAGAAASLGNEKPRETRNPILEHLQAALILDYATFLVALITIVFAVFLGMFGLIEWRRWESLKQEFGMQRQELAEERDNLKKEFIRQREELAEERQGLLTRIDAFKSDIESQEKRLVATQRFLEAVLSQHSSLLVGIVKGFGSALKPDEARKLLSLIAEAEATLDLFYPDKAEVFKALLKLEQIGADGAVPSLAQLVEDASEDTGVRLRAQEVLLRIVLRLKGERIATSRAAARKSASHETIPSEASLPTTPDQRLPVKKQEPEA